MQDRRSGILSDNPRVASISRTSLPRMGHAVTMELVDECIIKVDNDERCCGVS